MAFQWIKNAPGGLPTDKDHLNFKWFRDDCDINFSVTKQGKAVSIHFTSDKRGLRLLKQAVNEFVDTMFHVFPWCEMVIGKINRPSVERLAAACGFLELGKTDQNVKIWVRLKNGIDS